MNLADIKGNSDLEERKKSLITELKKKQDEIEKLEIENKELEEIRKREVYTPEKRDLSEFIKEWITVFNDENVYVSKSLETEGFNYTYSELWGAITIKVKSKDGLTRRKFRISWFTPELEIEITRDFQNKRGKHYLGNGTEPKDYNWIVVHLRHWERKEEEDGHKLIPEMRIKTYSDIEYDTNEWIEVQDSKLIHYLTILRDDLKNHLDMKIIELRKNGVE